MWSLPSLYHIYIYIYLYFNYSINWWATVVSLHLAADLFFLPRLVFVNEHFWNGQYQSVILLNGNIVENLKWDIPLVHCGPDTRRSQPGDIWARELLSTAASHQLRIWNVGVIVVGSEKQHGWIFFQELTPKLHKWPRICKNIPHSMITLSSPGRSPPHSAWWGDRWPPWRPGPPPPSTWPSPWPRSGSSPIQVNIQ